MNTGPANPLRQIWAVATLTLREASRRRAFSVLIFFGVALMSSMTFFAVVDLESRLRLLELWSTRVSTFFAAIVAVVLAGYSIPGDIDQKRIYLLASKPISRVTFFLGKFAGFGLLLALFFTLMGLISLAYIRIVQFMAGPEFPELRARPRVFAASWKKNGYVEDHKFKKGLRKVVGDPNQQGWLIWEFRGLKPSAFDPTVPIRFKLEITGKDDPFRFLGTVLVTVVRPGGGDSWRSQIVAQSNQWMNLDFPARLVPEDGSPLQVIITPAEPPVIVIVSSENVFLFEKSESFEWNFAKGSLLMLFQSLLVMSITLMGTAFLSAPVSILMGMVLYLFGTIHGFVSEGVSDINMTLAYRQAEEHSHTGGTEDVPRWVLKSSTSISGVVLSIVPDFEDFDFSRYLLADLAVSGLDLARALGEMSLRAGILLVLGVTGMFFKDFG